MPKTTKKVTEINTMNTFKTRNYIRLPYRFEQIRHRMRESHIPNMEK